MYAKRHTCAHSCTRTTRTCTTHSCTTPTHFFPPHTNTKTGLSSTFVHQINDSAQLFLNMKTSPVLMFPIYVCICLHIYHLSVIYLHIYHLYFFMHLPTYLSITLIAIDHENSNEKSAAIRKTQQKPEDPWVLYILQHLYPRKEGQLAL